MPTSAASPAPPHARRARVAWIVVTAVALAAAGACFGEAPIVAGEQTVQLATEAARARSGPKDSTDTTWVEDSVTVAIEAPDTVAQNAPVPMQVRVHNGRRAPVELGLVEPRGFDIVIASDGVRADSAAVWSLPRVIGPGLDVTVAAPLRVGADTVFPLTWPGQDDIGRSVPPGAYVMRAVVRTRYLRRTSHWSPWRRVVVRPRG